MQRSVVLTALGTMLLATFVWTLDAWARAGSGGSSGSRGSRSFSAPANPGSSPSSPSRQATPPSSFQQSAPQRSGWMSGLMGGIGGFLLGGLLGSMLFGGMGHGLFGGIGFMEILLIAGVLYFVFAYLRRRQQPASASSYGYTSPREADTGSWQSGSTSAPSATMHEPDASSDLERGLGYIRQMDAAFDPRRFSDTASDIFFKVQGAWMGRDMTPVRDVLTPEMFEAMQKDCERLRAERRIDHMENIAVRAVDVTEAWQESGRDYVTVRFLASMLDYTIDEQTNQVIAGSRSEPVKFEEYWTFVRPVGPNPWRLSAIQQAQ
jgi:predicted lipid-binding transport protein (Tim44 family)